MVKLYAIILLFLLLAGYKTSSFKWLIVKQKNYTVYYTSINEPDKKEYLNVIKKGVRSVETFWGTKFKNHFDIYIHPNRQSIDSCWQKDWKIPDFKSECWMVASGDASKLNLLSPTLWDKEACEHNYSDSITTHKLITHELFHVFHGQLNASPDFSNTEKIDWFVEGLATYASGQCDSIRIMKVRKAILDKKAPESLDDFWTGNLKYGLSGSMIMYINSRYGRMKLKELLVFNKKTEILQSLKITETELLANWSNYMTNYKIPDREIKIKNGIK